MPRFPNCDRREAGVIRKQKKNKKKTEDRPQKCRSVGHLTCTPDPDLAATLSIESH